MMIRDDSEITVRLERPRILVEAPITLTDATVDAARLRLRAHGIALEPWPGGYWLQASVGRAEVLPEAVAGDVEAGDRDAWIAAAGGPGPYAIRFAENHGVLLWRNGDVITLLLARWDQDRDGYLGRFESVEADPGVLRQIEAVETRDSWLADEMRRCLDRFGPLGGVFAMGLSLRHDLPEALRDARLTPFVRPDEVGTAGGRLLALRETLQVSLVASDPEPGSMWARPVDPKHGRLPRSRLAAAPAMRTRDEVQWLRHLSFRSGGELRRHLTLAIGLWLDEALAAAEAECPTWQRHALEGRELIESASELLASREGALPLKTLRMADRSVRAALPSPIAPVASETLARASLADPDAWWAVPLLPSDDER